jgi:ribosome maturation factor RimP
MIKLKTSYLIAGAVIATAVAMPLATFAHAGTQGVMNRGRAAIVKMIQGKNRLTGTVTAITGTTLTVTDAKGTVYTVDASTAKIGEAMDSLSIANILVGDKVMVTGTITGTTDAAKTISDPSMIGRNVFTGTVTAVNGTNLTIETMVKKVKTTYTVNATSAAITSWAKTGSTTITAADVKVGDKVVVDGSLSATTVTATAVHDLGQMMKKGKPGFDKPTNVFSGTVTSVSGSTITVTGMNKTVYTIDAGTATITKGMGAASTKLTIGDIKTGDKVFAVGALTGTNVVATSVRDLGVFTGKRMHKPFPTTK